MNIEVQAAATLVSLSACVCPETVTKRLVYVAGGVHPAPGEPLEPPGALPPDPPPAPAVAPPPAPPARLPAAPPVPLPPPLPAAPPPA